MIRADGMDCDAVISECGLYRYVLTRTWDAAKPYVAFVGLNPSTADEVNDDPTIGRCIAFSKAWGYGGLVMLNLFAFRATQPADMIAAADPIGPLNDFYLREYAAGAGATIASWGVAGAHLQRGAAVRSMLPGLKCLWLTKDGFPKHPLYVKGDKIPFDF